MFTARVDLFSSLVLLPTANALGHLAPAIGASWAAIGRRIWDYPVLMLLFSVHTLLDIGFDKYIDVPLEKRPGALLSSFWAGTLILLIAWSSCLCGFPTAIRIVWYIALEVFWAVPLIPLYTPRHGFRFSKLRQLFGPLKSVFCGVMAGLMDAEPAAYHACLIYANDCSPDHQRMQSLAYSILYNFIRESFYDARDIDEDTEANVTTMATSLGMSNTIAVLVAVAVTSEVWISGEITLETGIRSVSVVGLSSLIAITQTRDKRWPFRDNFAELLMLEATGNWGLVDLRIPPGKWNYFGGKAVVTADPYPEDIDTQSIANTVMRPVDATAHAVLDEILASENEEGLIPLYFQKDRPRVCVEVCANACTFFYTYGRGHEVRKTFEFVLATLRNRDFGPNRYYFTPEPLMYYCCRLAHSANTPELLEMRDVLRGAVEDRIGSKTTIGDEEDNAACLAIRLLICQRLGTPNPVDLKALLELQEEDGSFGIGWYYGFGKSQAKIGHRGLTAALSVKAIKGAVSQM
ncbi:hypothetical protein JX266_008471 [Neoarthrinium moseri]|nr:hypothetical protein JX266_008471 [Neoarthrinium moseri]